MSPTPKERARNGATPENQKWLFGPDLPPREVVEFIQGCPLPPTENYARELAETVLKLRVSELAEAASIRVEKETGVLIQETETLVGETKALRSLTRTLVGLTVGLLLLTAALLIKG